MAGSVLNFANYSFAFPLALQFGVSRNLPDFLLDFSFHLVDAPSALSCVLACIIFSCFFVGYLSIGSGKAITPPLLFQEAFAPAPVPQTGNGSRSSRT